MMLWHKLKTGHWSCAWGLAASKQFPMVCVDTPQAMSTLICTVMLYSLPLLTLLCVDFGKGLYDIVFQKLYEHSFDKSFQPQNTSNMLHPTRREILWNYHSVSDNLTPLGGSISTKGWHTLCVMMHACNVYFHHNKIYCSMHHYLKLRHRYYFILIICPIQGLRSKRLLKDVWDMNERRGGRKWWIWG